MLESHQLMHGKKTRNSQQNNAEIIEHIVNTLKHFIMEFNWYLESFCLQPNESINDSSKIWKIYHLQENHSKHLVIKIEFHTALLKGIMQKKTTTIIQ